MSKKIFMIILNSVEKQIKIFFGTNSCNEEGDKNRRYTENLSL